MQAFDCVLDDLHNGQDFGYCISHSLDSDCTTISIEEVRDVFYVVPHRSLSVDLHQVGLWRFLRWFQPFVFFHLIFILKSYILSNKDKESDEENNFDVAINGRLDRQSNREEAKWLQKVGWIAEPNQHLANGYLDPHRILLRATWISHLQ